MGKIVSVLLAAAALAGCQSVLAQDNRVWQRFDGQRMAGNATFTQQFEQAKFECLSASNVPQGTTITQSQTVIVGNRKPDPYSTLLNSTPNYQRADPNAGKETALFFSCMGGRGYKLDLPPT